MKYPAQRNLILAFLLFFSLVGCKNVKKIARVDTGAAKAHTEFFSSMDERAFKFNTFSARVNAELNISKNELSSRVDLKIVKDSLLQLSVQPFLGVEVFRVIMSPENILIIDRLNRRYLMEDYENLRKQTPIAFNFYNLQALFINRIFLPGKKDVGVGQYNDFALRQDGYMAEARVKDSMGLQYQFMVDGEEKLMLTYISDDKGENALQWSYTDFRKQEDQIFPMLMEVLLVTDGKITGSAKLNFSRLQMNEAMNLEFSIPAKYTQVTYSQIMKSLSSSKK